MKVYLQGERGCGSGFLIWTLVVESRARARDRVPRVGGVHGNAAFGRRVSPISLEAQHTDHRRAGCGWEAVGCAFPGKGGQGSTGEDHLLMLAGLGHRSAAAWRNVGQGKHEVCFQETVISREQPARAGS